MTEQSNTLTGTEARATVNRMGEAIANFLASLSAEQRRQATFAFEDQEERTFWHYTPIERKGLPLTEMDRRQQQLAEQVVATGLSRAGFVAASTIMGLERTLDYLEGWQYPHFGRNPERYYIQIYGEPDGKKPWGWQFEGHHISLNYTIVDGRIVAPTPTFFGANPAESPLGNVASLRPLAGVEDLARELLHALDEEQQHTAVLTPVAPADIVLRNRPYAEEGALHLDEAEEVQRWMEQSGVSPEAVQALRYSSTPSGLAASAMTPGQQEILQALIQEYTGRMPDELAEIEMQQVQRQGIDSVHFAWAGQREPHQPHYYRLQGTRFLVEYDNTQNDANHIHSVWRDPANDFGRDLLAHHYAHSHS